MLDDITKNELFYSSCVFQGRSCFDQFTFCCDCSLSGLFIRFLSLGDWPCLPGLLVVHSPDGQKDLLRQAAPAKLASLTRRLDAKAPPLLGLHSPVPAQGISTGCQPLADVRVTHKRLGFQQARINISVTHKAHIQALFQLGDQ